VCETPFVGSHASVVHAFPSSTLTGVPPTHVPAPSQVLDDTHAFALPHVVPEETGVFTTPP
jgi:hypothetical protein